VHLFLQHLSCQLLFSPLCEQPSETVLRKLVVSHGGLFLQHYSSRSVTHIITNTFTTHQHECKRYRAYAVLTHSSS
jgi:hypothetical protein